MPDSIDGRHMLDGSHAGTYSMQIADLCVTLASVVRLLSPEKLSRYRGADVEAKDMFD